MWVLFKFDLSEFMAFAGTNPFTHNVTVHLKCLFKQQLVEHKVAYRYEKRLSKNVHVITMRILWITRLNETSTCEEDLQWSMASPENISLHLKKKHTVQAKWMSDGMKNLRC